MFGHTKKSTCGPFRISNKRETQQSGREDKECVKFRRGNILSTVTMETRELPDNVKRYLDRNRFQWQRGLRRGSGAAVMLGLWVKIQPRAWMPVSRKCCVLSGGCLFFGPITHPEESYRMWSV
jgi:hypothetical protein